MDPQQRLLLEVAIEALEDAGQSFSIACRPAIPECSLARMGMPAITCGCSTRNPEAIDAFTGTGTAHNLFAGRLSYLLRPARSGNGRRHRLLLVSGGRSPRRAEPARRRVNAGDRWRRQSDSRAALLDRRVAHAHAGSRWPLQGVRSARRRLRAQRRLRCRRTQATR